MLQVSIIFELLRSQPRMLFWLMTLTQAALWWLVPSLFYSAPPGDLPILLAVGHEFQVGSFLGPPLASWLAEIVFDVAGMPGVYLLSQACVVVTYWAMFTLGRAIVGDMHATLAVMLMVGTAVFGLPTVEFGPSVLAMALTALMILHFWRALGEGRRRYWLALAVETGLLLMTSYTGLILCLVLVGFTVTTRRGRAALGTIEPWIAGVIVVMLVFPQLIWLDAVGEIGLPTLSHVLGSVIADADPLDFVRVVARVVALHGGFVLLIALASGWGLTRLKRVPVFLRPPVDPFAKMFVHYHAVVPLLAASVIAAFFGERSVFGGVAPLVILFGLAIVVAAGDMVSLHRQRLLGVVWAVLLVAPPVATVAALFTAPWVTGTDFQVTLPGKEIGRYFSDNFARRTGRPLEIVAGEERIAALVALYARPRASLYLDATPSRSPWITQRDVASRGAVVVWPAAGVAGTPPPDISARFPGLVPDVRRTFERTVQGRAPLLRVGWGIVRPQQ